MELLYEENKVICPDCGRWEEVTDKESYKLEDYAECIGSTYTFLVYQFHHTEDLFPRYWVVLVKQDGGLKQVLQAKSDESYPYYPSIDKMVTEIDVNFDGAYQMTERRTSDFFTDDSADIKTVTLTSEALENNKWIITKQFTVDMLDEEEYPEKVFGPSSGWQRSESSVLLSTLNYDE